MSTMNVSLPDELKSYVEEKVSDGAYGSTSEYVRDLIRRDRDRQELRRAILDGASSIPGPNADATYFTSLRDRIRSDD
jgi:antitoxin ParD1/3/4